MTHLSARAVASNTGKKLGVRQHAWLSVQLPPCSAVQGRHFGEPASLLPGQLLALLACSAFTTWEASQRARDQPVKHSAAVGDHALPSISGIWHATQVPRRPIDRLTGRGVLIPRLV